MGVGTILDRILQMFFWLGIYKEIWCYYALCPECQLPSPGPLLRVSLIPLPIIEVLFERIVMNLIDLLEKLA